MNFLITSITFTFLVIDAHRYTCVYVDVTQVPFVQFRHILFLNIYIQYNVITSIHYIDNRWKWDFDGSYTAYDVVCQLLEKFIVTKNVPSVAMFSTYIFF